MRAQDLAMAALLPRFEIRYFPLLAKGLGPALVAEHSGLPWSGSETLGFSIERDWATLKPRTPFGQLPLLTVVDSGASVTVIGRDMVKAVQAKGARPDVKYEVADGSYIEHLGEKNFIALTDAGLEHT